MTLPDDVQLRAITAAEKPAFIRAVTYQFGDETDEETIAGRAKLIDPPRAFAAFAGDQIVGTARMIPFSMSVPGGEIPIGGLSAVGVRTDYRRRGLLTGLMRHCLSDAVSNHEIASALYASEPPIYGRYGYGPAVNDSNLRVRSDRLRLDPPATELVREVRLVSTDEALEQFPEIYQKMCTIRPGALTRGSTLWRLSLDPVSFNPSRKNPRLAALPGRGYLVFTIDPQWNDGLPDGTLEVRELVAADPEAEAALWTFAASVDLVGTIEAKHRPVCDPLTLSIKDPAHLQQTGSGAMYLRLIDIPACLEARRYDAPGTVTLGIDDPFLPDNSGTYRLHVGGDRTTCERTDGEPDLVMDVGVLSAAYLGGESFTQLAWARRLQARAPDALAQADRMFHTAMPPWNPVGF